MRRVPKRVPGCRLKFLNSESAYKHTLIYTLCGACLPRHLKVGLSPLIMPVWVCDCVCMCVCVSPQSGCMSVWGQALLLARAGMWEDHMLINAQVVPVLQEGWEGDALTCDRSLKAVTLNKGASLAAARCSFIITHAAADRRAVKDERESMRKACHGCSERIWLTVQSFKSSWPWLKMTRGQFGDLGQVMQFRCEQDNCSVKQISGCFPWLQDQFNAVVWLL